MSKQSPSAGSVSTLDTARFEQIKATGDLPSPKGPALAVIRLTQKDSASLGEIAQFVKTDPAFVGRLIKSANGSLAHGRRPLLSIHDALTVLGIPAVRGLALSFSLLSGYRSGNCRNFDYGRYWSHSLLTAVAMQAIAKRVRMCTPDEAFTLGLLARVGELALATCFADAYSRLLGQHQANAQARLDDMEREAFALTSSELTQAMLIDWGFPRVFADPARYFRDIEAAGFSQGSRQFALAQALNLAMRISDICLTAEGERRAMLPQLFLFGGRLSIEAEVLTALCDGVVAEWADWGALLNVDVSRVPPFEELSAPPEAPAISEVASTDSAHRLRVLVVDDEASMRAMLKALLIQAGHEVFEAVNGLQAFDMALDLRPQLMILDWMMPEMTGVELTRSLRQTKIGRGIYIILLTALEDEVSLINAFEGGVDDFISKPLKPRVLAARLRAGQRVVQLQQELERDREEIRKFAAELAITNRRLHQAALTDALTGFPNRRYAMERLEQEWQAAQRSGRPLSCLVVDLDSFKPINDRYGHDVGDSVLRQTATAIKSGLRGHDVVCRIGGDEFLVICPDTPLAASLQCGERIRRAVESLPLAVSGERVGSSISVGAACREEGMADIDALIKAADQGAYLAKQGGRNRVASVQKSG